MARRTKEEAEATRESVLTAALDLFSEKGYSRTTFSDIAKRIEMTRGAIYWHFDNKPALLAALMDHFCTLREQRVELHFSEISSPEELREAFLEHARLVVEDKRLRKFEFFMMFQMEWSEELLTETHKLLDQVRKDPFKKLTSIMDAPQFAERVRKDIEPRTLAVTLAGLWLGLLKVYLGACPKIDLVSAAADGFDCMMNGILLKGDVL